MIDTNDRAPDFTLPALDGLTYALHEADADGPLLLAFWQAGCGACRLAAPYLNRLDRAYENIGWSFWTICQDEAEAARAFVQRHDFSPLVLVDGPGLTVSRLYDPDATPTVYLIEPGATVSLVSRGFDKDDLNEISRRVARYTGADYVEVAPADDGNPRFKPG